MKNNEILLKAILKAAEAHKKLPKPKKPFFLNSWFVSHKEGDYLSILRKYTQCNNKKTPRRHIILPHYLDIIFSHKFAKAFWGDFKRKSPELYGTAKKEGGVYTDDDLVTSLGWQYHLQQMVLVEEPIKYLEQFLK